MKKEQNENLFSLSLSPSAYSNIETSIMLFDGDDVKNINHISNDNDEVWRQRM